MLILSYYFFFYVKQLWFFQLLFIITLKLFTIKIMLYVFINYYIKLL